MFPKPIMKKYPPILAGIILGLLFLMASVMFLLKLEPEPKFPEGSPIALFMGAFGPTGYMTFVKVFELLGGLLVAIPRTRNLGLLVLGPILVNILAFHIFIAHGADLLNPMLLIIVALTLYLLWVGRNHFRGLLN
jgi:putative oxidoreductase